MKITKKIFAAVLCFSLIIAGSLPVCAESIIAVPTASAVIVNGKNIAFDAYGINNNNYFKLRDLAFILKGTEKQFDVAYDAGKNAIILTSGKAYTEVGGEMSGKGGGEKTASLTASKIYLDNKQINLTAYIIGGNNYFKLRDVGQALDFGVDWDGAKNTIVIDTRKGYTPEIIQSDIIINPGNEYELPGTLTLPDGIGPFPVVIIGHGSGPGNRDGEMLAIKVYKDLAEQLASFGIASIRYDKRTLVHGQKMAADVNLTVKEETIDDLIYAAKLALQLDNIDKDKIYIAGHSLSGYLLPRIYAADINKIIAGYISLAGSARPLTELILEQTEYIIEIDESMPAALKTLNKNYIKREVDAVLNLTEADRGKKTVPLSLYGVYPTYWLDLAHYNPCEEIKKVDKPMLFLQGGNDYQVTEKDFNLWKEALKDRTDVKFILYPNLTHAFTYTEQKSKPADYMTEAPVDRQAARDIADFIKG